MIICSYLDPPHDETFHWKPESLTRVLLPCCPPPRARDDDDAPAAARDHMMIPTPTLSGAPSGEPMRASLLRIENLTAAALPLPPHVAGIREPVPPLPPLPLPPPLTAHDETTALLHTDADEGQENPLLIIPI
jgi:hypothetical protein